MIEWISPASLTTDCCANNYAEDVTACTIVLSLYRKKALSSSECALVNILYASALCKSEPSGLSIVCLVWGMRVLAVFRIYIKLSCITCDMTRIKGVEAMCIKYKGAVFISFVI